MSFLKGEKTLIGPSTFGARDQSPLQRLREVGCEIIENPYKRKLTKDELLQLLTDDVTGLIAGLETLDEEVLAKAKLKVISRCGAGLSNVDLEAAKRHNIKVCSTPDGPTTAVAELTIASMLNLLRSIHVMSDDLHRGKWTKITGSQLEGKTVAIIGMGRIGRKVATLLKSFQVNIIGVDCHLSGNVEGVPLIALNEALPKADIITVHASGDEQILGPDEFAIMKKGAHLLNAARGKAIDEDSLIKALKSGIVAGVWIDTFHEEPYAGPLMDFSQTLLTPHVGSYTVEGRRKMEMDAVHNLINAFRESYAHAGN